MTENGVKIIILVLCEECLALHVLKGGKLMVINICLLFPSP